MTEAPADTPTASFETKWASARPEFGLALKFIAAPQRAAHSAFACLRFELEHAAFGIREAEPAAIKLRWWAEEFDRAGRGDARHPLTQALATHPAFAGVPRTQWYAAVGGALAQRDPPPAADRNALLDVHAALYRPLAAIESLLFTRLDVEAVARADALARALRECATLADALRDGRLPLPLDWLAQYRLARGDLAHASDARNAGLRAWLATLGEEFAALARADIGVVHVAGASADGWRARSAAGTKGDPLPPLGALFARLPLRTLLATWRASRVSSAIDAGRNARI